jgi:hypothetical protein
MDNTFELSGEFYPYRLLLVKTPSGEETWCISNQSLNHQITYFGHRDFASEIIDEEVFFYVEDEVLFSDELIDYLHQHVDVEFEFIQFED